MNRPAVLPRIEDESTSMSRTTALASFGETPVVPLLPVPAAATEAHLVEIVIADDQPIFRHGLRRLLETNPRLRIVGETGECPQTVALVENLKPDVLLLGTSAGKFPFETLERIAALATPVR